MIGSDWDPRAHSGSDMPLDMQLKVSPPVKRPPVQVFTLLAGKMAVL
jgi:hypothetical protein